MNWEEATSPDFASARESCGGVCLLPMGVLEKHGTHLPLGTDGLSAHELCVRAATRESAMVFPEYYFGSIAEARQHPGTVALPFALILDLLEAVCDEISRNGFKKIILVNAHGGNTSLLDALSLTMLKKQKDYMVYYRRIAFLMDHPMMESRQKWHGHADEGDRRSPRCRKWACRAHRRPEQAFCTLPLRTGLRRQAVLQPSRRA